MTLDNSGWLGGRANLGNVDPTISTDCLPLAYQLDDPKLIEKAKRWVEWTLHSQPADGQFGPAKNDWWPRMVMLKVLTQYAEVSGDPRVIPFMTKYFAFELTNLPHGPCAIGASIAGRTTPTPFFGSTTVPVTSLLDLAKLLHEQGYDWEAQFADFQLHGQADQRRVLVCTEGKPSPTCHADAWREQCHGPESCADLVAAVSGNAEDRAGLDGQLAMLDKYHGLPNGIFSGDEHLAGPDPSQGIELCAVVETMFSFEEDFAIVGDATIADRLERVAYNALPATLSNDMWSHQYDQQPNQIACTRAHRQWSTNGDDSNLFGLDPNFGCCTANLHQGWPKFVSSLWMATNDGGLIAAAYAPNQVKTLLGDSRVTVEEATDYPFHPTVCLRFMLLSPHSFPLMLRIPGWALEARQLSTDKPRS